MANSFYLDNKAKFKITSETNAEDVSVIYKMVNAELEYYANGGRPTELFGVYTPKKIS